MAGARRGSLAKINRLFRTLRTRVPFYNTRLPVTDLKSLAGLAEVPFTQKEDFRQNYPFGMFAVPLNEVARVHASSGTTGKPVLTGYTSGDLEAWGECMERVLRMGGVTETDVLQNAYGYGLFTGGLGFHLGAERLGCTVVPTSAGMTARQVMLLRDLGSTVLTCTPSYALVLAEALVSEPGSGTRLRVGFFGAEPWTEGMRRQIETGLGLEAYDIYGLTELGGPGVAVECNRHDGLHIFEDHFLAEVVDPDTGRQLGAGEEGELVLTSLTREASPVVRYRTRDRVVLVEETCDCGSPFRRMSKPRGRTDDMLIVRGVNVFPSAVEEVLLGVPGLLANYQIGIDRGNDRQDRLTVRVEGAPGLDHQDLGERARARLRELLGIRAEVMVVAAGSLPRSEGKARRVVDRAELG
ncbi:MAG: phenylacetate--CoA ligase [Candidatus Dormibacteraeota bacterium]|nr:phenylacetate--CoA ligase [Candidatus Dormibacteraeota bacterium]